MKSKISLLVCGFLSVCTLKGSENPTYTPRQKAKILHGSAYIRSHLLGLPTDPTYNENKYQGTLQDQNGSVYTWHTTKTSTHLIGIDKGNQQQYTIMLNSQKINNKPLITVDPTMHIFVYQDGTTLYLINKYTDHEEKVPLTGAQAYRCGFTPNGDGFLVQLIKNPGKVINREYKKKNDVFTLQKQS
jgi:hypothetical protein